MAKYKLNKKSLKFIDENIRGLAELGREICRAGKSTVNIGQIAGNEEIKTILLNVDYYLGEAFKQLSILFEPRLEKISESTEKDK